MLARVERFDAAVERFLALRDAVLSGTHFAQTLLALGLRILLQLESFVLRFDDGLAAQRFGLSFRVVHHGFGLLRRSLRGCVDQVAGDDEAEAMPTTAPMISQMNSGIRSPFRFSFR